MGAYQLCFEPHVRIGGSSNSGADRPEIALLSNLFRCHARILRSGEVWLLDPLGPTTIDGRSVARHTVLQHGNRVRLGDSVELLFRQPSVLSGTARIDIESGHQTQPAVDGVILFAETCVLGTGSDAHLPAPPGSDQVLLIRWPSGLWCKAAQGIQVQGVDCGTEIKCAAGSVYAGQGWCFRLE